MASGSLFTVLKSVDAKLDLESSLLIDRMEQIGE